jgi:hypothetical protein
MSKFKVGDIIKHSLGSNRYLVEEVIGDDQYTVSLVDGNGTWSPRSMERLGYEKEKYFVWQEEIKELISEDIQDN